MENSVRNRLGRALVALGLVVSGWALHSVASRALVAPVQAQAQPGARYTVAMVNVRQQAGVFNAVDFNKVKLLNAQGYALVQVQGPFTTTSSAIYNNVFYLQRAS